VGGVDTYRQICSDVVSRGYLGFAFDGPGGSRCHDGVICRLQPDVQLMLAMIGRLGLPPMESLDVEGARALSQSFAAARPPGPTVGAVVDGVLPGAAGDLAYRLYRPASPGPHPHVAYFHGGGWVLGGADADDPFCRDLCVRSDAVVVSVDYRHAPEARSRARGCFTAVGGRAPRQFGGMPVASRCGWSAGATSRRSSANWHVTPAGRDDGQVLVAPVTSADFTRLV
jgi:hypothetical protein